MGRIGEAFWHFCLSHAIPLPRRGNPVNSSCQIALGLAAHRPCWPRRRAQFRLFFLLCLSRCRVRPPLLNCSNCSRCPMWLRMLVCRWFVRRCGRGALSVLLSLRPPVAAFCSCPVLEAGGFVSVLALYNCRWQAWLLLCLHLAQPSFAVCVFVCLVCVSVRLCLCPCLVCVVSA